MIRYFIFRQYLCDLTTIANNVTINSHTHTHTHTTVDLCLHGSLGHISYLLTKPDKYNIKNSSKYM